MKKVGSHTEDVQEKHRRTKKRWKWKNWWQRIRTELGPCVVLRLGRSLGRKHQRSKEKNIWLISKTRGCTCTPTVFVQRHSSRLMRSGKNSHKHNLSCYGHELLPICLSSAEPSKSFSSQPSARSHPGKSLWQQNMPRRRDKQLWCCRMKILPSLFLLLSSSAPLFLPIYRFPFRDTFQCSNAGTWTRARYSSNTHTAWSFLSWQWN